MENLTSLEHHLLIAMPNLNDGFFDKSVVYIVEDNEYGSMGLILNRPHNLTIEQLLEHFELNIEHQADYLEKHVMLGGPVDLEHGFILHKPQGQWQKSLPLQDNMAMTVSEDLLEAMAEGKGPSQMVACLGFSGWEKGQLNDEIQNNSWLTIPFNDALMFDIEADRMWEVALGTLGISPEFLSMEAGHD